MSELDRAVIPFNIPTEDEVMATSIDNSRQYNPIQSFAILLEQSVDSYNDQNTDIMMNQKVIDSYFYISFNDDGLVRLGVARFLFVYNIHYMFSTKV